MLNYTELRKFLAQDKLAKLVEALHAATARLDTDLNNQVVAIAGRLTRISNQLNTGQISHEEANKERSRISAALLDIINQLETDYPAARQQTGYQQQQPNRQAAAPAQQSRPIWPYILLGVVGCIVVLAIIGNMAGNDSSEPNPNTSLYDPTKGGGGTTKLADESPAANPQIPVGYTAADLAGVWEYTFPYGKSGQGVANIRFNGDGTCVLKVYLNKVLVGSKDGMWQLSGNTLQQPTLDGGYSNRELSWANRNQFRSTDKEKGTALIYNRVD